MTLSICLEQNPCTFGACGQLCWAQGSTRYCHCEPGFELLDDKFTCESTGDTTLFLNILDQIY